MDDIIAILLTILTIYSIIIIIMIIVLILIVLVIMIIIIIIVLVFNNTAPASPDGGEWSTEAGSPETPRRPQTLHPKP